MGELPSLWDVLIKIVVTLPAIIFALGAWRSSHKTGKQVNGRMDEYKRLIAENADLRNQLLGKLHSRRSDTHESIDSINHHNNVSGS